MDPGASVGMTAEVDRNQLGRFGLIPGVIAAGTVHLVMPDALAPYRAKRDFTRTAEPEGRSRAGSRKALSFVVQKHAAKRLHYDLRLELDGVLKSWAVTKGPSLIAGEKRLAVHVEDHPLDYGDFEGTIPEKEYGAGTVLLWDRGTWRPDGDPHEAYASGRLTFTLEGEKLNGAFHLVRMRPRPREKQEQWLLIKSDDAYARTAGDPDILDAAPLSVKTGRDLDAITANRPARAKSGKKPRKAEAAPFPEGVTPCLATLVDAAPRGAAWLHEIKWDGYRLLGERRGGKVRLLTRNGHDWTGRFPAIAAALEALPGGDLLIDGEAVILDASGASSFSALQEALSLGRDAEAAVLYAFDCLYAEGEDLRARPLAERKERLGALLAGADGALRFSDHIEGDGDAMIRHACRIGLEGVVSKRADRPYRSGRRDDWLKTKCTLRDDFVVLGYQPSSVSKKAVGSLLLGYRVGKTWVPAGRTGTGFSARVAADLFKRLDALRETTPPPFMKSLDALQRRGLVPARPDLVVEVEFRGWTAEGSVRHAAYKGLREDKDAAEITREKPVMAKPGRTAKSADASVAGVTLTHPDRVMWEEQGLTKLGLAEFYQEIGDWILPHIVGRPLALVRCPSGSEKQCFFQKHAFAGLHESVKRVTVGDDDALAISDLPGLIALVQSGVLEIHPWGSTLKKPEQPDRLIFDLDPGDGLTFADVVAGAREVKARLEAKGLAAFVKTTGGKGLHVVTPLKPKADWEKAKEFCRSLAEAMEKDTPARYVATAAKAKRKGRIFVDYLRNGRGATAVAPYSTRARPGAPVAVPVEWTELESLGGGGHWTVDTLPGRLAHLARDPWGEMAKAAKPL
jgi:bifunctional non-homologous end joining protein LigD